MPPVRAQHGTRGDIGPIDTDIAQRRFANFDELRLDENRGLGLQSRRRCRDRIDDAEHLHQIGDARTVA